MKKALVQIVRPLVNLTTLVSRPGGKHRDEVVAEASRRVEAQREPIMDAIDTFIKVLAGKLPSLRANSFAQLDDFCRSADQINSLAETFKLHNLSRAARSLCDLCQTFTAQRRIDIDAITVHVYAMQLLGPKSAPCSGDVAAKVLKELDGLVAHFSAHPLAV
jgi:hypothetical protein